MDEEACDEINTLVAHAVNQELLLWQTTSSLLEIKRKLDNADFHHKNKKDIQKKNQSRIVSLFQKLKSVLLLNTNSDH